MFAFKSLGYILDVSPALDLCFGDIFSEGAACVFIPVTVYVETRTFSMFTESKFWISPARTAVWCCFLKRIAKPEAASTASHVPLQRGGLEHHTRACEQAGCVFGHAAMHAGVRLWPPRGEEGGPSPTECLWMASLLRP